MNFPTQADRTSKSKTGKTWSTQMVSVLAIAFNAERGTCVVAWKANWSSGKTRQPMQVFSAALDVLSQFCLQRRIPRRISLGAAILQYFYCEFDLGRGCTRGAQELRNGCRGYNSSISWKHIHVALNRSVIRVEVARLYQLCQVSRDIKRCVAVL